MIRVLHYSWRILALVLSCGILRATAATVNYTHRTGYYATFVSGTAGIYDNGGNTNEVGHYAQGSGGQSVAWRNFRTADGNGGSLRELQPGDRFKISVFGSSPFGILGCALLDNPSSTSSWNDRTNNARVSIQCGNGNGDLFVTYTNNATASWSGVKPANTTVTLVFDILSGNEVSANVEGQTAKRDLFMLNTPGSTQRVDKFSIYYNDDWNGTARQDAFWKVTTSVENLGYVEVGADNGTRTIWGVIADGLAADSASAVSTNRLLKSGSGTIFLNATNVHSGPTEIRGGTLIAPRDSAFGAVPASAVTNVILTNNLSTILTTNNFTLSASRVVELTGPSGNTYFWNVANASTTTVAAAPVGLGNLVKAQDGTLALADGHRLAGNTFIDRGTLSLVGGSTVGGDRIVIGTSGGDTAQAAALVTGISLTNNIAVIVGSGARTLQITNTSAVLSGTLTNNNVLGLVVAGTDAATISGVISSTGSINKTGGGTLTLSGNNTFSGALNVSGGTVRVQNGAGSASGSGTAFVNAGSTISGTGRVYKLNVGNGGVLSPGSSPGTLTAGDTTLDTNGVYVWEINDFAGSFGADPGWDRLNCTGTLTIAATSANTYTVKVTSLTYANVAGVASNFNNANGYTQLIASAVSLSGFATNKFTVNVAGFSNPFGGTWTIAQVDSTNLAVVYTPPAAADVAVFGNNLLIADGDTSPSAGDHTDFGTVHVGTGLVTRTFTITNNGSTVLGLGSVATSGTHAADFIVISQPSNALDVGTISTFQVQFDPSAVGTRSATISFTNTVTSKSPYDIAVQGSGVWPGIGVGPTNIDVTNMVGNTIAAQTFAVTNIGSGTLNYTATAAPARLTVAPGSGSLSAGSSQIHTNVVSASGLAAGSYISTNTIADPAASNSPKLVTFTLTLTNIPSPTAVSATADGAEMVRLSWTESAGRQVLVVYRQGSAPTADPTNATAYNVGDSLGGGTVIAKVNGSGTREHVVAAGTGHHYRFYTINNDHYSLAVSASATTASYLAGEIVEPFAYTNAVPLSGLAGGQGWTNTWSVSAPNSTGDVVVDAVNFTSFPGSYPAETGNRLVLKTTNTANYRAVRGIAPVSCGKIYVAAMMRREFAEGAGDGKYSGISVMSGTTESGFIGETAAGNDQFGAASGGGETTTGAADSFAVATDYLVILRYDFDAGSLAGQFYTTSSSVPSNEPSFAVTRSVSIAQIDGVRLSAGATTSGWPGQVQFDELRVARSWADLLNLLPPRVTNLLVDTDNVVTDGQMTNGTFELRVDLATAAGIDTDGTPFAPNFDVLAPGGVSLITDSTFDYFTALTASSIIASDTTHAVSAANVVLGVHTVQVSAVSSNGGRAIDVKFLGNACTGSVLTFTVTDDDTAAPAHSGFAAQGRDLAGGTFTNLDFLAGLSITGTVTDAGSGVYGGTSNRFSIIYQDGTVVASGFFIAGFSDGGATSGGSLSNIFNHAQLATAGIYTMSVFSVDYDIDRAGDATGVTSKIAFTVVDPPPAPGLAFGPAFITHNVLLGDNATNFTFAVTNVGIGTLHYTNYQSYGAGSGWLAVNPTSVNLAAAASRIHTGYLFSATFTNAGTYVATNRLDGDQTNAAQFVTVNLVVTNIPDPTASATATGAEMIKLNWSDAAGRSVLVVHRANAAPTADPTNGTAYNVGDALGGGTVIAKASSGLRDHVFAPGATNFYRFYAINNDRYSPGVTAAATTSVYRAYELVEPFAYTNGLAIGSGRNGGQGFTNAWSANFGTYSVITDKFVSIGGYPAAAGNSVTGNNASAFRGIPEVTSGKIYVAFHFRTDNGGGAQYGGLSFFDGATEEKFIGEGFSQVNQLTVGSTAGRNLANNTDYLIVGMYDFAADKFKALLYTNATESVPSAEPETWHVEESDATVTRINRLRFESNVGIRFDEVRVATNWPNLFARDNTYPYATNFVVNGGVDVTDAQMANGGYEVVYHVRDAAGIESVKTLSPYFAPNYDVFNANGVQVLTNESFTGSSYLDSGLTFVGTDTTHAAVNAAQVTLGSYTSRFSAVNSNGLSTLDYGSLSNSTALSFNIVDDDAAGPILSGFVVTGTGAGTVTVSQIALGGWSITGVVQDAGSGVNENGTTVSDVNNNVSPSFTIYNSTGAAVIVAQLFATRPTDGAASNAAGSLAVASVTNTVALGSIPMGVYTARVTVADNDEDRTNATERATTTSDVAIFEVVGVPLLAFGPTALSFASSVGVDPSPAAQTFAVTNAGTGSLVYTNVITYSTNGSGWVTVAPISNEVAGGFAQIHTATVASASLPRGLYVATNTIFAGEAGTGRVVVTLNVTNRPWIGHGPATLAYNVMLGSLSSNATFAITNLGDGAMGYSNLITYGTGASGWFTTSAATGYLAGLASQIHTGTVSGAIQAGAGIYVATNAIVSAEATNSPQLIVITATVTNIPAPVSVTAVHAGAELVRLTAAESAGRQILVVHVHDGALTVDPTNGVAYSVGDLLGAGRVVAKFTGSAAVSNLEHVAGIGGTNTYRFYTIYNNYYSPAVEVSAPMESYPANSIVEQFGYTNSTSLSGLSGGTGWSGVWSVSTGGGWTNVISTGTPNFPSMPSYPTNRANAIRMSDAGNGGSRTASRSFPAFTSNKVFASFLMAYDFPGAGKYAGLSFLSNGVEKAFVGEVGGADRTLGLDSYGAGSTLSSFNLNPNTAGTAADTGNVYLVVASYDFTTRELKTKAYYRTVSVPRTEPITWDATVTVAAGRINSIDGVRLGAGSTDSGATVGNVWFDEVRVAATWNELLGLTAPFVTNYLFDVANQVSDGQVTGGTYSVLFDFRAESGMSNSLTVPNIDVLNPAGVQVLTDIVFSAVSFLDNGRSLRASNAAMGVVSASAVTLGVYTSRWSAFASNEVGLINSTTLSNGAPITFSVYDDDTNAPVFGTNLDGRAMELTIGGTNYGSGSSTDGVYAVTDADLAQVAAANPLRFVFNVFDVDSSIVRGNSGGLTNLNYAIGASGVTNVLATYSNGLSSVDTSVGSATSVFHHTAPFTIGGSGFSETGEVYKMIQAATNVVLVSATDRDEDRASDATSFTGRQAGLMVVTDDDVAGPVAELLYVGTNYSFGTTNDLTITDHDLAAGGKVDIAYRWYDPSGLFVTNTDLTKTNAFANQGNVSMNWDITNGLYQVGTADRIHSPAELHGHNGDLYVTNVLQDLQAVPITNIALTTWNLTVSSQDMDNDRGTFNPGGAQAGTVVNYDRAIRTNQLLTFNVVDEDTTGPNAVTQSIVVARGGDWTNNLDVIVTWDTNGVTDLSGVSGYRVHTNAPVSPLDIYAGTNAGAGTSFVWSVSAAHEGVLTNVLFALDNDSDRTNDFAAGDSATFTTRLDRTPPAMVTNLGSTLAGVADDATELKVTWAMLTNAGIRASDGDPLSPWKSYVVFYTADGSQPTTNSANLRAGSGPADLGTNVTTSAILSNLTQDTAYRIAVVGLDVAGNYGPIAAVVTQRTAGLVLTQGLVSAQSGVSVRWAMRTNLTYDVIYQDAASWADTLTNGWTLLTTVTNEFPNDTGTLFRTPPQQLGATMRFYRVAAPDVWRATNPVRRASREIYVAKPYLLAPGENWIALFFEPDSNSVAQVLGTDTNRLPAGNTLATATKVSWYAATNNAIATNVIWLSSSGNWMYSVGGAGIANDKALPVHEGFSIEVPGTVTQRLVVTGRLTTNVVTYTAGPGSAVAGQETYHLRSLGLPRRVTMAESGLRGIMTGGVNIQNADEIRILNNASGSGSKIAPKTRIWKRSDGYFMYSGGGFAETNVFEPGDLFILIRRTPGTVTVTNGILYAEPGKNVNP